MMPPVLLKITSSSKELLSSTFLHSCSSHIFDRKSDLALWLKLSVDESASHYLPSSFQSTIQLHKRQQMDDSKKSYFLKESCLCPHSQGEFCVLCTEAQLIGQQHTHSCLFAWGWKRIKPSLTGATLFCQI